MSPNTVQKVVRCVLVAALIVVAIRYAYLSFHWHENNKKIPAVSQGNVVTFSAEMSKFTRIVDVDASEQYIYFAYSGNGVVAVYDWNGVYQYSFAFFSDTNGGLGMRCEDGLLYVSDYANYEFVFSGDTMLKVLLPSQERHSMAWFDDEKEIPIAIRDQKVYDKSGNFIMDLPGRL
jgi:hypothetical protein